MKPVQIDLSEKVIQPSGNHLVPVREATIYPAQASHYLRDQLQGQSVVEAAGRLGVKASDLVRMLDGTWKPTKDVCQKLGLTMVYAITEAPANCAASVSWSNGSASRENAHMRL
jgi:hypothetical protein